MTYFFNLFFMRKREIFGAAALAVGIGVTAEKAIHDPSGEGDKKSPPIEHVIKSEPKPPSIGVGLRLDFGDKQTDRKNPDDNGGGEDGGFGGEDVSEDEMKNETGNIETAIAKAIPDIYFASKDKNSQQEAHPGGYYLNYPGKEGIYSIKQITKVKRSGDETEFQLRDVARVETQEDGTFLITDAAHNNPRAHISCDSKSIPQALGEYVDYKRLIAGSHDDNRAFNKSLKFEDGEDVDMDSLLELKQYYEQRYRDIQTLLSRDWQFVSLGEEERALYEERLGQYNQQMVEVQRSIAKKL